jgi:hypothetical protein
MQALPGGKAKHDTIDSQNMTALRRGGMLPQADVYPAARRATRARLRRRMPLARQRAERRAHVQQTHSQDPLPALGTKMADKANRDGGAERCADPAVHQSSAVDRARISYDAALRRDGERPMLQTATHHDANPRYRRHTVPGLGTIRSLVWRYASQAIHRLPPVQDVVSYGRLVTCAKASAGTRLRTSGTKLGKAQLTWAFSAAAVLCRRDHPPAQTDRARGEDKHAQGQALTGLAQTLARAVDDRLTRHVAVATDQVFPHAWRGADAPGASLDIQGMTRPDALDTAASRASLNAQARIGRETLSPARCLDIRSRSSRMRR